MNKNHSYPPSSLKYKNSQNTLVFKDGSNKGREL